MVHPVVLLVLVEIVCPTLKYRVRKGGAASQGQSVRMFRCEKKMRHDGRLPKKKLTQEDLQRQKIPRIGSSTRDFLPKYHIATAHTITAPTFPAIIIYHLTDITQSIGS